jgi:Peptidase family M50
MPNRCCKCGVVALESEEFIEENFPFTRRRFYCPACHHRIVHRIMLGFTLLILAFGAMAIIAAVRTKEPILNLPGYSMLFLVIVQWLMIIPHELGHAVAARLFGYTQIRIAIGMGKPLLTFDLGGFYWIFNPIPFGGLTFFKPPAKPERWRHLIVVSAGLGINAAVVFVSWLFIGPDGLFHSPASIAKLLFWGNVVVIAENLFPRAVRTSYGNTFTDGWQIWHVLFRWNKPEDSKPKAIPFWEVFICHVLKWMIVLVLFVGALFFAGVASMPFLTSFASTRAVALKGVWSLFFVGLACVSGWYCWRVFREPIARMRRPAATPRQPMNFRSLLDEEQFEMLEHASKLLKGKYYPEAIMLLDRLLSVIADQNSEAYNHLLLVKVQCHFSLQQADKAEALCDEYAQSGISKEQKLKLIDGAACFILYQPASPFLKHAERLVRAGLEIAPGTLTLKGTLGALLVEQGNYTEAEPLLADCLERSPALHDRGIATFYLGMIKLRAGEAKDGKRLIKRGMNMYPEPWIVVKGQALLKDVGAPRVPSGASQKT